MRGETKNDLVTKLFKGYVVCSNKVFVKVVTSNQEGYEEIIDILPENMMHLSVRKLKLLKKTNKCNTPSESEYNIISIQSEVEDIENNEKRNKVIPTEYKNKLNTSKDNKVDSHRIWHGCSRNQQIFINIGRGKIRHGGGV